MFNASALSLSLSLSSVLFILAGTSHAVAQPMSFRQAYGHGIRNCFIVAEGEIVAETPDVFLHYTISNGRCGSVVLRSAGGNLMASVRLGRLFRAQEVETIVDSSCESGCAYAFLGGVSRSLERFRDGDNQYDLGVAEAYSEGEIDLRQLLGFHRFYSIGRTITSDEAQLLSGELIRYIVEMGVDARNFVNASRTGLAEMYYPTAQELFDYQIVSRAGYEDFFLEPYLSGVVAASRHIGLRYRARPVIQQLTNLCRRTRAELLLSLPDDARQAPAPLSATESEVIVYMAERSVLDQMDQWRRLTGEVRRSRSMDIVSVPLSRSDYDFVSEADYISIWIDVPHAFGYPSYERRLTNMDRAMIRSSFGHCIE